MKVFLWSFEREVIFLFSPLFGSLVSLDLHTSEGWLFLTQTWRVCITNEMLYLVVSIWSRPCAYLYLYGCNACLRLYTAALLRKEEMNSGCVHFFVDCWLFFTLLYLIIHRVIMLSTVLSTKKLFHLILIKGLSIFFKYLR